jgi:outer membrane protein, heavy metal efflux system
LAIDHTTTTVARIALALICAMIGGCQSYHARPLDPVAHAELWQSRSPSDRTVGKLLEGLESAGGGGIEPGTFDPDDGLTLVEAELVALVFNADLRLSRLRAGVARATAEHAGLWEDPVFQIDILRILEGVANPWVISPGLAFTIPLSGRLEVERARASAALQVELVRIAEAEWAIRRELRELWARWSALQLFLEETRGLLGSLDQLADGTRRLVDAGELLRTEAALFSIERSQQQRELRRLEADLRVLELQMRRIMGLAPSAPVNLVGPWLIQSPELRATNETDVAAQNLTLRRLEAEYQVAEESLRHQIARQYPDLTFGPVYESDQGQSRLGLLGGVPLPLLNRNRQGIAEALAVRELARGAYEIEYERVLSELALLAAQIEALGEQRAEIEETIGPMVDQQQVQARRLLELGEAGAGGALVLLDSVRQAHAVKLDLIELRRSEALAEVERRYLMGPPRGHTSQLRDAGPEVLE